MKAIFIFIGCSSPWCSADKQKQRKKKKNPSSSWWRSWWWWWWLLVIVVLLVYVKLLKAQYKYIWTEVNYYISACNSFTSTVHLHLPFLRPVLRAALKPCPPAHSTFWLHPLLRHLGSQKLWKSGPNEAVWGHSEGTASTWLLNARIIILTSCSVR